MLEVCPVTVPQEIFPSYDFPDPDWKDPYQRLSQHWRVPEEMVYSAFRGLRTPEYVSSEHLSLVKRRATEVNAAAKAARKLALAMRELPENERHQFLVNGTPTVFQIECLADVLANHANNLENWQKTKNRRGGRNPGAHLVAEGVRRLFRRQRLRITFGQDSNGPTTDFCRSVEAALGEFGIRHGWRQPARAAYLKQLDI